MASRARLEAILEGKTAILEAKTEISQMNDLGRWNGGASLATPRAQRVQLEHFTVSHAEASLADAADSVAPPFH